MGCFRSGEPKTQVKLLLCPDLLKNGGIKGYDLINRLRREMPAKPIQILLDLSV
jgi:hypothetical protein